MKTNQKVENQMTLHICIVRMIYQSSLISSLVLVLYINELKLLVGQP